MKRITILAGMLMVGIFNTLLLSGQCVPDTVNCIDIDNPGEICPLILPVAELDSLYDETVTVIPPGSFLFGETQLNILHIRIDSVKNMPPGIDYFPNADILYPDTAYCIQLTGTPTEVGVDTLAIYITAMVDILEGVEYQVVDDTSLVLKVVEVLGTDPYKVTEFQVFQNVPNPFSDITRLACYSPVSDRIELRVYNMLGVQVYQETDHVVPGEHYFKFDGSELQGGTYFYQVKTSETYYTGKLIKSD
ncbi:MAG: T9SS type A sorting domain-containing protein [Bacteroidota bacterium]|nr:T9SS type A sorting domain-containing protein [Bacteroidota bacterium]